MESTKNEVLKKSLMSGLLTFIISYPIVIGLFFVMYLLIGQPEVDLFNILFYAGLGVLAVVIFNVLRALIKDKKLPVSGENNLP